MINIFYEYSKSSIKIKRLQNWQYLPKLYEKNGTKILKSSAKILSQNIFMVNILFKIINLNGD